MKASASMLLATALLLFGTRPAGAQFLPPVGPLTVTTATAGFQPAPVTRTTTFSAGLFFFGQKKVTGQLNANMPPNTTLGIRLTAPSGGTSLGTVNMDVTPRNLVVAATPVFFTNVTILFTFTTQVAAGVIPTSSRIVTYTLANYP